MSERQFEFTSSKRVRVATGTWNVNGGKQFRSNILGTSELTDWLLDSPKLSGVSEFQGKISQSKCVSSICWHLQRQWVRTQDLTSLSKAFWRTFGGHFLSILRGIFSSSMLLLLPWRSGKMCEELLTVRVHWTLYNSPRDFQTFSRSEFRALLCHWGMYLPILHAACHFLLPYLCSLFYIVSGIYMLRCHQSVSLVPHLELNISV